MTLRISIAKYAPIFLVLLCVAIVVLYVGLIPIGHWQTDDYLTAATLETGGFQSLLLRILHWSPRPFSETLIFLYVKSIHGTGAPHIGEILGLAWIPLILCLLIPALASAIRDKRSVVQALVIPFSLLSMFFLDHPVAELFYWPMAAIAYLPTLAALVLVFAISETSYSNTLSGRNLTCISLLVAALSTEVGAMYVAVYCVIAFVTLPTDARTKGRSKLYYWLTVPFFASMVVLWSLVVGRVAADQEVFGDTRYVHHLFPSIVGMIPHAAWAMLSSDDLSIDIKHLGFGILTKTAFFIGVFILSLGNLDDSYRQRMRIPIIVASLLIVPVTIFTSYFQFGTMACCERHDTFRQCLIFVALASTASFLSSIRVLTARFPWMNRAIQKGYLALGFSLIVGLSASAKALHHDYSRYNSFLSAQKATWQSGLLTKDDMTYFQTPYGHIVGGYPIIDEGRYCGLKGDPAAALVVCRFFHKKSAFFSEPTVRK